MNQHRLFTAVHWYRLFTAVRGLYQNKEGD